MITMKMTKEPYTEKDLRCIDFLIKAGHGWAKFASNVKAQGWVSPKQSETLNNMVNKLIEQRFKNAKMYVPSASKQNYPPIEGDHPAMGSRKDYYDEESSSWYGETYFQGNRVNTQWHDNGNTTYHWGGPCAPTTYDKNGEEC